jgi:cation:H+ antiporter
MLEPLAPSAWSLGWSVAVFLVAGAATVVGSVRLVGLGDTLADRTGWGEALFGAVFFGLATSLSGIVMTATAAASGQAQLGYSNAVGGIVAQTVAIAVADASYRRANLEHAAASPSNLLFGCLLIALLSLALLATWTPDRALLGVHPVSVLMVGAYLGGLRLIRAQGERPMWRAVQTTETRPDEAGEEADADRRSTTRLWALFVPVALVVSAGGWAIASAAGNLVQATGLEAGFVGAVLMGVVNALPETVTALAAVRRGALTLAVAAVLGGNSLDALNLVVGDVAFRGGSLFHAAGNDQLLATATGLFMTAVLLAGLLVRQSRGWGRVGFEGSVLVVAYLGFVGVLVA